ncbi:MAG TPA: hypothetical protein VKY39_08620, partial [Aggregatilineales bacterium]|nr:hypothetical protein [Aggregatilineales bacterium]
MRCSPVLAGFSRVGVSAGGRDATLSPLFGPAGGLVAAGVSRPGAGRGLGSAGGLLSERAGRGGAGVD